MIRVEKLSFSYPGDIPALHAIDLQIEAGEVVALIGPNGSGKTTLARCLNGLQQPREGRVLVDGLDTRDGANLGEIRRRVGMVFQNPDDQLVATTVESELAFGLENLGLDPDEMHRRVDEVLQNFGLEAHRRHPPHRLSGGEKQRVAIAAAVAMRPRYLILDEPTALLDPRGRRQIDDLLQSLRASFGIATLLITQLPAEAARADRLIVLHQGQVYGDGAPADLFADPARLRDIGLDLPFARTLAYHLSLAAAPLELDALSDALAPLLPQGPLGDWSPPPRPASTPTKLKVEALTHLYDEGLPTQRQGIGDIDLDIPAGTVLALVGESGSGKTTLAQHFNALLKPSRGRVLLEGRDIWSEALIHIRQRIGLVFQFPELQLFAESVSEDVAFGPNNLGFAPDRVDALVTHALDLVGMPREEFGHRQPLSLSGGEKRRVALAGILAMDPEVLVLDEPTAGLDPRATASLCELITHLQRQGRTLVLISHDMDLVGRLATDVAVLREGRIRLAGPSRAVLAHPDFDDMSGLEPPSAVRLSRALRQQGHDLGGDPLTLAEAVDLLAPLIASNS
jgi:energy-coupling factor transport system ATP-binding protein